MLPDFIASSNIYLYILSWYQVFLCSPDIFSMFLSFSLSLYVLLFRYFRGGPPLCPLYAQATDASGGKALTSSPVADYLFSVFLMLRKSSRH